MRAAFLCPALAMSLCTDVVVAKLPGAGVVAVRGRFRRLLCLGRVKELRSRARFGRGLSPREARTSAAEFRGRSSPGGC